MTVRELIEALEKVENKDLIVVANIGGWECETGEVEGIEECDSFLDDKNEKVHCLFIGQSTFET